jgi:hypothetical protein
LNHEAALDFVEVRRTETQRILHELCQISLQYFICLTGHELRQPCSSKISPRWMYSARRALLGKYFIPGRTIR